MPGATHNQEMSVGSAVSRNTSEFLPGVVSGRSVHSQQERIRFFARDYVIAIRDVLPYTLASNLLRAVTRCLLELQKRSDQTLYTRETNATQQVFIHEAAQNQFQVWPNYTDPHDTHII